MISFRNFGLLTKVVFIIVGILLSFFALSTFLNYRQQRTFILEESVEKARIIASEAIQAREYISKQLQIGGFVHAHWRTGGPGS